MRTFKQFVTEMDEETIVSLISKAADRTPKLRLHLVYEGDEYEGFVDYVELNSKGNLSIHYKTWSEGEHAFVPGTVTIWRDEIASLTIKKDYEGKNALMFRQ